jgi:hypothetical protein
MQRERHREIRVIHDFDFSRNRVFHCPAKTVSHAGRNISHPRGHHARDASRTNHLIEQNVRDRTHDREIATPLPYQLVPRCERDHLFELGAEKHHRAGRHVARDRVAHRHQF